MIHMTRFDSLGYERHAPGLWRIMHLDGDRSSAVGPFYASKAELLSDLTRYARESWGLS